MLWLLLPVAAASGWIAAKNTSSKSCQPTYDQKCGPEYYKGLNYLLNEQPDKAIDVFTRMLDEDSETVETHLALGSLFRKRGEVDRAIRIHQALSERPSIEVNQRSEALYELGKDFLKAGLLDRAENLFKELSGVTNYKNLALTKLTLVYEKEKDWNKAIESCSQIKFEKESRNRSNIAHYYCELAEKAIENKDVDSAWELLIAAQLADNCCIRVSVLLGDVECFRNNFQQAIAQYKKVEVQNPQYLSEVINPIKQCYEKLDDMVSLRNYLEELVNKHHNTRALLAFADIVCQQEGSEKAANFMIEYLREHPSLRGIDFMIDLGLKRLDGFAFENFKTLKELVGQLIQKKSFYQCNHCGFSSKSIYWQCPQCRSWSTLKPIQGLNGV
jgi:lipopolysaccharide biosynthesis regulator YciM